MNYWWVNHKQTFNHEFNGGYIWSPRENKDGSFNLTYLNLTKVSIGDVIFSFAGARIKAIGIVEDNHLEAQIPKEFKSFDTQWNNFGYLVKVAWTRLENPIRPKDNISLLKPLLPKKFSPIQENGNGNQKCYLANKR